MFAAGGSITGEKESGDRSKNENERHSPISVRDSKDPFLTSRNKGLSLV